MLYNEFLEGTGAIDTPANYAEYKRVEEIYMAADSMTKTDAYRMAVVVTEKDYKKQQKAEIAWVKQNIIPAAAFVRGMSDKASGFRDSKYWLSDLAWSATSTAVPFACIASGATIRRSTSARLAEPSSNPPRSRATELDGRGRPARSWKNCSATSPERRTTWRL